MPVKVLFAGCSKDEREQAEALVCKALGPRAEGHPWTVSLVRIAGQWSVTLDGPSAGVRARTFMAAEGRLREAIVQALEGPPAASAAPTPRAAAPAKKSQGGNCRCGRCGKPYRVVYEASPDEPEETVPVACPHCWQVNHVLVAESAAESHDYRAEKA